MSSFIVLKFAGKKLTLSTYIKESLRSLILQE